jgi:hypothetical protein
MVRSDAVEVATPTREGFSYEVAIVKEADERFPCFSMIRPVHPEPLSPYVSRVSSTGPIVPGVFDRRYGMQLEIKNREISCLSVAHRSA